jgi:Transcriptional regulators
MNKKEKSIAYKERVLERIKQAIIAQKFPAGHLLNERKLAEEMDVSRTPVREAIQMLELEGWVEVFPWRGAVVQPVTIDDIEETFQLRMAIEPLVIDLIWNKLGEEEIYWMELFWERQLRLSQQREAEKFILLDQEFHLFLAELTNNRRLCQFMSQLRDTHLRMGVEAIQQETRFEGTLEEHRNIIDALKNRKTLKARQAMLDHLLATQRSMIRHIKETEEKRGKK